MKDLRFQVSSFHREPPIRFKGGFSGSMAAGVEFFRKRF
ncbi:hypothetical protein MmTuc01_1762 [Methanosarcina mazei Tuc01]|uniref:Uncharacterized protein n=1 Tax=Methanosarcina mazei Tuc01 TaxID=1236903 RepID=M1Q480_METMZ|nr:hypothetical protein MmTuc01_1762 [Methanosarcina mazei Tuc01]